MTKSPHTTFLKCSEPTCQATVSDHYHGRVEAHLGGWFFSRDKSSRWCPTHLPEWVPEYRAKKAAEKEE